MCSGGGPSPASAAVARATTVPIGSEASGSSGRWPLQTRWMTSNLLFTLLGRVPLAGLLLLLLLPPLPLPLPLLLLLSLLLLQLPGQVPLISGILHIKLRQRL